MDWKKFFKPTRIKIVVFFILLIPLLIPLLWIVSERYFIVLYLPVIILTRIILCKPLIAFYGDHCPFDVADPIFNNTEKLLFVVWAYLLACILIPLYNKYIVKKK